MTPFQSELLLAVMTFLGGLLTNAFFYGRLTQQVKDHDNQLDDLKHADQQLWSHMSVAERDIARMQGAKGQS